MPQPLFCCFCSFVLCAEIILKYAAVQDNDWSYVAVQGGWDDGWPASMLLQFKVCLRCGAIKDDEDEDADEPRSRPRVVFSAAAAGPGPWTKAWEAGSGAEHNVYTKVKVGVDTLLHVRAADAHWQLSD